MSRPAPPSVPRVPNPAAPTATPPQSPGRCGSVGQCLLQELLVLRAQTTAQRVEEHQPVLGPLGRPRRGQQLARGSGLTRAYCGEQGDPLGEQPLLPELLDFGGVVQVRR